MSKVITFYSDKHKVGKTTSAFFISYFLNKMGKKVTAIDLDKQEALTTAFNSVENYQSKIKNIKLIKIEAEEPLLSFLKNDDKSDVVLIDTGSDMILNKAALAVSDEVIIPILGFEGLRTVSPKNISFTASRIAERVTPKALIRFLPIAAAEHIPEEQKNINAYQRHHQETTISCYKEAIPDLFDFLADKQFASDVFHLAMASEFGMNQFYERLTNEILQDSYWS
ncbi:ParA family protein [Lentilactobacillus hilgardii]|uniref:ParA family protein n=1 Tax=Lentilactobacillus hilgardii TaxID=1588 RepID=UPI003FA53963